MATDSNIEFAGSLTPNDAKFKPGKILITTKITSSMWDNLCQTKEATRKSD